MKPYAITGVGVVSPIGVGYEALKGTLAGAAGPSLEAFRSDLSCISPTRIPDARAAEVWGFDAREYLGAKGLRNFDRLTRLMVVSAKMALIDAGVKEADGTHRVPPERIGLCSATAYGSLDVINQMVEVAELEDPRFLNPGQFPNTVINSAAGYVSIWEDLRAPNVTVVDGNCGALDAVLTAETHLMNDRAAAFLVGGGEVLSEPLYLAFRKLSLLSDRGRQRRIGHADSEGMFLGEGAAYLCVERVEDAMERGARARAELVGYGNAVEPPQSEAVIVHGSPRAVERAVAMALSDAGLQAGDIDLVCSSLSGVPRFDLAELQGLRMALPNTAVVATKAWYGETFGAGGALAMACALAFFEGLPPRPLIGPDAEPPTHLRHVLVLSTGYYGNVSAVILRRP